MFNLTLNYYYYLFINAHRSAYSHQSQFCINLKSLRVFPQRVPALERGSEAGYSKLFYTFVVVGTPTTWWLAACEFIAHQPSHPALSSRNRSVSGSPGTGQWMWLIIFCSILKARTLVKFFLIYLQAVLSSRALSPLRAVWWLSKTSQLDRDEQSRCGLRQWRSDPGKVYDVSHDAWNGTLPVGRPSQSSWGHQSEKRAVRLRLRQPESREERAADPTAHERFHGLGEGWAQETGAAKPGPAQRGAEQNAG